MIKSHAQWSQAPIKQTANIFPTQLLNMGQDRAVSDNQTPTPKPNKIGHIDIIYDCLGRQPANCKSVCRARGRTAATELQNCGGGAGGGTSPERPAPTTFRRSVSSGRCERDSEDQASAVVGGRSFLASVRNTRQFETFTDGLGGGWVHPSVVRDRSFCVSEEKHAQNGDCSDRFVG